ncbi:Mitochondrial inner membrane protein OXA1 [Talaromyces islandicus]|uniref:Mitochondrial inner membrane protein OXA1 n=1 Tax=Talaromyces islandicus TaxID=28573 RepID=A0A0U1LVW4_TALIS|nr:Mitochondrial inner membrane protein OXA1 [Talaromyces islandicus]
MLGSRALSRYAVAGKTGGFRPVNTFVSARSLSHIASRPNLAAGREHRARLQVNLSWTLAAVSGSSFARFNSTSTNNVPAGSENVTQVPASDHSLLEDVMPISQIPERLGYLKDLGLDYGWGPSAFMEWMIEHIHMMSGIPWWASIVASAALVRLALFKPAVTAANNASITVPIKDKVKILRTQRHMYLTQGKQLEAAKVKEELDTIHKDLGISVWKNFLPILQIPLGFGCFRVVRGMTSLPVPALASEHAAWITDLTTYDPLFLLPLTASAMTYFSLKKGAETGMNEMMQSSLGKGMMVGLPVLSMAFISFQPAALQLYFATSGALAFVQAYLINTPSTRAMLGMVPIPSPQSAQEIEQSRAQLRMIQTETAAAWAQKLKDKTEMQALPTKEDNMSRIDKMMANAKKEIANMKTEMNEKMGEMQGKSNSINADGSPTVKPRLTDEQKKQAQAYKVLRDEEDKARYEQRIAGTRGRAINKRRPSSSNSKRQ